LYQEMSLIGSFLAFSDKWIALSVKSHRMQKF